MINGKIGLNLRPEWEKTSTTHSMQDCPDIAGRAINDDQNWNGGCPSIIIIRTKLMRNGNSSGARIITQRNHQCEVVKAIVESKTVLLQYCHRITYNTGLIENYDTVVM